MSPHESSAVPPRWPRLGAWAFIVVGAVHLVVMASTLVSELPPPQRQLLAAMSGVTVSGLGVERSFAQLYFGFSVAMAVFVAGYGLVILEVARRAPQLVAPGSRLNWLSFAMAAGGFAIAAAAFPTPPVLVLGLAALAFGWGLMPRAVVR